MIEQDTSKFLKSCIYLTNLYSNFEDELKDHDDDEIKEIIKDNNSKYNHKKHMFNEMKKVFTDRFIEEYAQTKLKVKTQQGLKELCLCDIIFDISQTNYEIIFKDQNTNKIIKAYKDTTGLGINTEELYSLGGIEAEITQNSKKYLNEMLMYIK